MPIHRILLAALCLVCVALTGCGKSGSSNTNAQMRILNAFAEAPSLNVTVNAKPVATALTFPGLTQYAGIDGGTPTFIVSVTGAPTTLVNSMVNVPSGNYTYVVFGPLTGVATLLLNDSFSDPGNGFFAVRVLNAAAGSGALDIYLTAPGADLAATSPTIAGVAYGATSSFTPVTIGTNFEIRVTPSGSKDVIYDTAPRTFAEHSGTNIVLFGKGSGKLVDVAVLNDDSVGSGAIAENLLAQYKIVNASQVPSALNIFVDSILQLSNVPFTGVSNYQRTSAGAHNLRIEATSTPGATLLALSTSFAAATDTSIALTGPAGALKAVVLNDDNLPPPSGTAGVRVVNTSVDVPSFDVFVNFGKQISALASNTASGYVSLTAAATTGTAYQFDFNVSGATQAVLTLPGVVLTAAHKYTIYVAGPAGALKAIVTQDN
ncbi:MAG: DUF4397 domain-containing protein [Betaproteobacteria bacterium]|nr:MAG: DUF4397 domain-containing protein [Betaproteobacteria bacterium]TMH01916.1 MAG: DUF4397 domain-containing protein [Betaproteobacteria bacterium]